MNFKIVIPSYKRQSIITQKTLKLLCEKHNVPQNIIYIFVISEEFCSYKSELENSKLTDVNIIMCPLGLHNARNFITDYFQDGDFLLHIDDDIDNICQLVIDDSITDLNKASRYKLESLPDFVATFTQAFEYCKKYQAQLFGIYPVANGFFMKDLPPLTHNLRFCVGALYGIINDRNIKNTIEEKEDFERSLLFYEKYKTVLRFNNITIKTKYYKTKGGMQERTIDRKITAAESCNYLLSRFPLFTKLYSSKKSGMPEIRLITKQNLD